MSGWWLAASAAAPIMLTSARPVRKSPARNRALMRPRICRQSARLASRTCVSVNFSRGSVMLFAPSGVRGVALRHKVVAAQTKGHPHDQDRPGGAFGKATGAALHAAEKRSLLPACDTRQVSAAEQ